MKLLPTGRARTPTGSFGGSLQHLSAPELGAIAIRGALQNSGIPFDDVEEVIMGNVLSANVGQAPARQAAIKAGLSESVICTTINKVCASGMKAIMNGASLIALKRRHVIVCGGMESMSQVPYYLPSNRFGKRYGNSECIDGLQKDGLYDSFNKFLMGNAAELCAEKYNITRKMQDEYAAQSYKRAKYALEESKEFRQEIVPIKVNDRKKGIRILDKDEEVFNINFDKMKQLRPAFKKNGTVTAANASKLSDGASAVVLVSGAYALKNNLKVQAIIREYEDAEQKPEWFTTTPALAIQKVLKRAKLDISEVDLFEINEAFSAVALVNQQLLKIDPSKLNIFGGAVSCGHPLGSSGSRIVVTLISALKHTKGRIGCAAICNGGGGASALIIERCDDNFMRSSL